MSVKSVNCCLDYNFHQIFALLVKSKISNTRNCINRWYFLSHTASNFATFNMNTSIFNLPIVSSKLSQHSQLSSASIFLLRFCLAYSAWFSKQLHPVQKAGTNFHLLTPNVTRLLLFPKSWTFKMPWTNVSAWTPN